MYIVMNNLRKLGEGGRGIFLIIFPRKKLTADHGRTERSQLPKVPPISAKHLSPSQQNTSIQNLEGEHC
jgi:hypothetical protein